MNQKTNNPQQKQGLMAMAQDAGDVKVIATISAAEEIIIRYYFDMMCAMMTRSLTKAEELELPNQEPMRRAVTEINRICENQKKEYLFSGDIMNPLDLFTFASSIVMSEKQQKEGKKPEENKFEKAKAMAEQGGAEGQAALKQPLEG